jgi:hypothetical protein
MALGVIAFGSIWPALLAAIRGFAAAGGSSLIYGVAVPLPQRGSHSGGFSSGLFR